MSALPNAREPGGAAGQIAEGAARSDDVLRRDVYCILGLPIDAIAMPEAMRRIGAAMVEAMPFLISTINVNFLVNSAADPKFRESVLLSDLCPTDGMPIVWIARLLGIPIRCRVAGSDIFEALKTGRPVNVFLFGGNAGVAAAAAEALNGRPSGLRCVDSIYPGFGSVNDMSKDVVIDRINASRADFLVVSLGAHKGQLWLLRNHHRLHVPVRTHLGAVINFTAGTVKRAPAVLRKLGLEWLWRIKEEPHLWRRYGHDLGVLLRLVVRRVLPLAVAARWQRLRWGWKPKALRIAVLHDNAAMTLRLSGDATVEHVAQAISYFRNALTVQRGLVLDLSATRLIDARFFGFFLVLRKQLKSRDASLKFIGISPRLARLFCLHGVEFLLTE